MRVLLHLLCPFAVCIAQTEQHVDLIVKRSMSEQDADTSGAHALDGSPYAWYESPHSASIKDWIIYLEGGGECETHQDCVERSKMYYGTSTVLPDTVDRNKDVSDGMTSSNRTRNPRFAHFGTLYLPYLSGDDWLGEMRQSCVPWGAKQNCNSGNEGHGGGKKALFFSGALNFDAAIARWRDGLKHPPRRVLLSGGSAGGQGAFFLADRLRALLPDPSTVVKVNPQYGWFAPPTDTYPDWRRRQPTDPAIPYPSSGSPFAVPAWCYNISLALPQRCFDAAVARGDDPLVCTSLPTVALTVGIPLFISTNIFDGWLTEEMQLIPLNTTITKSDDRFEYLLTVTAPAQRESIRVALAAAERPGDRAAFVPACMEHPMAWAGLDDYWVGEGAPVLGSFNCTHADAVAVWFFEDTGPDVCEVDLIDKRTTFEELAAMRCNADVFKALAQERSIIV